MATRHKVITAIGADRPGLVNEVTERIHRAGANVEDSRMAALGGDFALMMLVSGDEEQLENLERSVAAYADECGLLASFRGTSRERSAAAGMRYRLQVSGLDHPGIVHGVASVLASCGVNVASLDTHVVPAPMSGSLTFVMKAELCIPANISLVELRRGLLNVCEEENLDLTLEAWI